MKNITFTREAEYAAKRKTKAINHFFEKLEKEIEKARQWQSDYCFAYIPNEFGSIILEEITKRGYTILNKEDINLLYGGRQRTVHIAC